ncbi:MAG: di-heme oxidoredictase family protein [Pseudomonas sp.]
MRRGWRLAAIAALVSAGASAEVNREAFTEPLAGLNEAQLETFFRGRGLFRQAWVIAPSRDEAVDGLGPLYNRITCIACHPKNGRGQAPLNEQAPMRSMLVRLSLPGRDVHGGPKAHPAYGDQLNEQGIPGVRGEGQARMLWREEQVTLGSGETVSLRRAQLKFSDLAYGPLGDIQTSARVGTTVYGLGLLDAVSATTLQRMAAERKPDGVRGRVNRVWSVERQRLEIGRFGLKANQPDLNQQIASALHGDMGLTSRLYRQENCAPQQSACKQAVNGGQPEVDAMQLGELHFYLSHLAPPPRRDRDNAEVLRGQQLFTEAGCSLCHRPNLTTAEHPDYTMLSRRKIEPYTDLLLHDMGEGLADGREDYLASGREWRTPPLWGIGLTEQINSGAGYLHDGRARTLTEAVLWHGGEAALARQRFAALPAADRAALMDFLRSL